MALDPAVQAWLLSRLGTATDVSDLETRYTRLRTARAVALEVLYERHAALIQQPTTINVTGVVGVGYGENIKALERLIDALESGEPPAPDDPADTSSDQDTVGVFFLHERPRR